MKTSDLTGPALDWAVAKCEGKNPYIPAWADKPWVQIHDGEELILCPKYSTSWTSGGPIIEREGINIEMQRDTLWVAEVHVARKVFTASASTPLVAAMRAFVASRLGEEIEVPEDLK